jgi:hypothetical protein
MSDSLWCDPPIVMFASIKMAGKDKVMTHKGQVISPFLFVSACHSLQIVIPKGQISLTVDVIQHPAFWGGPTKL